MVSWNTSGVWLMLAVACTMSVIGAARARFRVVERPHFREAPLVFLETCLDALLTGVGVGIGAVFLIMLVADGIHALGI